MFLKCLLMLCFAALFCFATFGQEAQSAAKPDSPPDGKPDSQPTAKPEIITTATLESFQRICQGLGFECTRDKDKDGKLGDFIVFRAEGYKVVASVPSPDYIMVANIFTSRLPLDVINEWNYNNRFTRAALGTDGNLYLVSEIITGGGVTPENIEEQIWTFRTSLVRWARFVIDHEKPTTPDNPKK